MEPRHLALGCKQWKTPKHVNAAQESVHMNSEFIKAGLNNYLIQLWVNIHLFVLLRCEDLLLFFVIYDIKLNIFIFYNIIYCNSHISKCSKCAI